MEDQEAVTAKTLEQEAREAAIDHGMWLAPDDDETNAEAFVAGYLRGWSDKGVEIEKADLAAATLRDREMRQLRLLAEDQLTTLRKLKAEMLSDTRDKEIEELRALLREACGILNDAIKTDETFWLEEMRATNEDLTERIMLMVPPIPVETK